MLEKETELILEILKERTVGLEATSSLSRVVSSDIPGSVKSFIEAEVHHWLAREIASAPHFTRIGETAPQNKKLIRKHIRALGMEYVFSRKEFLDTLDNAVHFVENYLCRPQWTLTHFLFQKESTISSETLRSHLDYVSEYSYLKVLILRYIERKEWNVIERKTFERLVEQIDREVVKQHSGKELALLIRPLYTFLHLSSDFPERTIPLKPILLFFEDKKLTQLRDAIERHCHGEISLLDLSTILERYYDLPDEQEYLEQSEGSDNADDPSSSEISFPRDHESASEQQTPQRNHSLSLTFAGIEQEALPTLDSLITIEQRRMFVQSLFRKDEAYYGTIISSLNDISNWKAASSYLEELFTLNELDPFDSDVVEFTDCIHRRYLREKNERP
jgi:hypothetical protein